MIAQEQLEGLYKELQREIPESAIRSSTYDDGSKVSMYGYQYIVNVLNEVLGLNHWLLEENSEFTVVEKFGSLYFSTVKVTLLIGNWIEGRFVPLSARYSYGSGVHELRANSLKAATTNGLKKAAAMFGVGKKAFEGLIEDYDVNENKYKTTVKNISTTEQLSDAVVGFEKALAGVKVLEELEGLNAKFMEIKKELTPHEVAYLEAVFNKMFSLKKFNKATKKAK